MRRSLLVLIALLVGSCDDEGETYSERNAGALKNGERCMATAADAPICAGRRCAVLAGTGAQFGACTEPCRTSCRHGGTCATVGSERLCVRECESTRDCPNGFGCIPEPSIRICEAEFECVPAEEKSWCLPLPQ